MGPSTAASTVFHPAVEMFFPNKSGVWREGRASVSHAGQKQCEKMVPREEREGKGRKGKGGEGRGRSSGAAHGRKQTVKRKCVGVSVSMLPPPPAPLT